MYIHQIQLEQTGTTIFQTFAGLLLDGTKSRASEKALDDDDNEKSAITKLLRVFFFLNICHLLSIIGLWTLDKRRKRQAAEAARQALLASVAEEEDFESEEVERSPKVHHRSVSFAKEPLPEAHGLQRREPSFSMSDQEGPTGRPPLVAGPPIEDIAGSSTDSEEVVEEERPLLRDEPLPIVVQTPVIGEAQSRAERIRGEICGVMGIALIAFAWVFFIGTAFLRLRAKKDRS